MSKVASRNVKLNSKDYWYYFLVFSVVAISLRFDTKTQDPFNVPKVTTLMFLIWLPLYLVFRSYSSLKNRVNLSALLLSIGFIATLIIAGGKEENSYESFVGIYQRNIGIAAYLFFILLMLSVALNFSSHNYVFTLSVFVALGSVQAIYGSLQQLGLDPFPWKNPYNPMIGTFGNPNFASAFLGCSAVAAVVLMVTSRIFLKILLFAQILLSLALITNSNSSQGLMAFAVGVTTLLIGLTYVKFRKYFLLTLSGSVVIGSIGLVGLLNMGPLSFLYQGSIAARGDYWRAAISMWENSPLFGVGFDSYGDYFGTNRDLAQVLGRGFLTNSDNAHNTFLHFLATSGVVGFAFYLLIHAFILLVAIRALRTASAEASIFLVTSVSIWLAFVSINLISPDNLGVTVWQWIFAGIVLGAAVRNNEKTWGPRPKNISLVVVACLILTLIPIGNVSYKVIKTDKCVWNTYLIGYSGTRTLPELRFLMKDCVSKGPKEDRYLALAASFSMGLKDFDEAITYTDLLLKQNKRSTDGWRLQAYSLEAKQDYLGANTSRLNLESLNPYELENLKNVAINFVLLGDKNSAIRYRDKIASIDPKSYLLEEIVNKLAN
jgi:O-antigen ligase